MSAAPVRPPIEWPEIYSGDGPERHVDSDARAVKVSIEKINAVFNALPAGANEIDLDLAIGAACPFSHWREKGIWLYVFRRIAWHRGWRWRGLAEQIEAQIAGEARD
jgi:hypothetical protein